LFVSIALWILDMDELEMFDFLENELHIVGENWSKFKNT
jgi:hypothetical protein